MMTNTNDYKKMYAEFDFRSILFGAYRMSLLDQFDGAGDHKSTAYLPKWRMVKAQVLTTGLITAKAFYHAIQG